MKRFIKNTAWVLVFVILNSFLFSFPNIKATGLDALNDTKDSSKKSIWNFLEQNQSANYNGEEITIDLKENLLSNNLEFKEIDEKKAVVISQETKYIQWRVKCPEKALYQIKLNYQAITDSEVDIKLSCTINGTIPYDIADNILLPRVWADDGEPWKDNFGNESSPIQIQKKQWTSEFLSDSSGLYNNPLRFSLEKGENTIGLSVSGGSIALSGIALSGYRENEKYSANPDREEIYNGKDIVIQAEKSTYKSSKELRPLSDRSDPSVLPSNAFHSCINYIGGSNWDSVGEKIAWEFNAPKSAYYKISFKYRQEYLTNASAIRCLEIDGKSPFKESESVLFPYTTEWKMFTFGDENPYYIWFDEGVHTLSLNVCLGPIANISRELQNLIYDVGELYRRIIMITGTTPDANRDYRLYDQIPTLNDELEQYIDSINDIVKRYDTLTNAEGGSNATTLKNLGLVLERMRKSKFKSQDYVSDLFNNYSSASAWVYSMRTMPLDLDQIIICGSNYISKSYESTFINRCVFGFEKLIGSFNIDYQIKNAKQEKCIDVWVNIGRDQSKALSRMVDDSFTPKTGIKANIKISSATMIQASLSGKTPDCTIMQERSTPVNLAMRGALYDLSQFNDFDSVVEERYGSDNFVEPYRYKSGVYGLPDTETFNIMYVRTDVFSSLGLSVPKTWDEFLRCSAVIMRNNLSVGVPQMFTTFLYQFNGSLYNKNLTKTNLKTTEAIEAFKFYTDIYCEYKLPVTFSFYNRFRTGEMPLAISPYTEYATLLVAASEISNCWSIYPVPGVENNGNINNTIIGSGTAAIILKNTKNPLLSWEFIKWWTSEDTQYRYSTDVESVVGTAARHPTANIHALNNYTWEHDDNEKIVSQYKSIINLPEVPGGYYLTRALENAFYSVQTEGDNPKESLIKWAVMVDEEMERKIKEYS